MAEQQETTVSGMAAKMADMEVGAELDLAFCLDCTGSMGSYIHAAQENIKKIAEEIVQAERADVRFALVAYRDHPPQDSSFVTQVTDFGKMGAMKRALDACTASGGGDGPEAVADALFDAYKTISWRPNATKICVLVLDAPPHGLGGSCGDGFPNGCPAGHDPVDLAHKMAEAGISLYVVGCEPSITPYKSFFAGLCDITGGQYAPMQSASSLSSMITAAAQEEINLERMMADVDAEVKATAAAMTEEEQSALVYQKMQSRKAKVMKCGTAELPQADEMAKKISGTRSMAECNKVYTPSSGSSGGYGGYPTAAMPEAAPRSSSFLGRLFGSRRSARDTAAPSVAMMDDMADMDAAAMAAPAPMAAGYSSEASFLSPAQCSRMVKKSRARNGYSKSDLD